MKNIVQLKEKHQQFEIAETELTVMVKGGTQQERDAFIEHIEQVMGFVPDLIDAVILLDEARIAMNSQPSFKVPGKNKSSYALLTQIENVLGKFN